MGKLLIIMLVPHGLIKNLKPSIFQLRFSQEFQVLGSQRLSELRDKISCVSDTIVVGEFSEKPNLPQDIVSGVSINQ